MNLAGSYVIINAVSHKGKDDIMILDDFRLDNKVAVVTGANTGLGQGMCVALAQAGAKVAGVARRSCDETKALIEENNGEFLEVTADLGTTEHIGRIIDEVKSKFGRVDILVNNAGVIMREDALDVSEENWNKVLDINLNVVFFLSQAFAREFEKQQSGGKIINVASIWGEVGASCETLYSMSKAGVIGLTKALAKELAPSGITVNCVSPGITDTRMNSMFSKEELAEEVPLGRLAKAEETARAIFFLAESEYITGQDISVSGGML